MSVPVCTSGGTHWFDFFKLFKNKVFTLLVPGAVMIHTATVHEFVRCYVQLQTSM